MYKALTICQPYAELILRGEKCVENRSRATMHRGPLLLHAGKSLDWWTDAYGIARHACAFGALVGRCRLALCIDMRDIQAETLGPGLAWMYTHEHCEGPHCWVLEDVERFPEPIPYRGRQGLFEVPREVLADLG